MTKPDDYFRDKFITGNDALTGVVSYQLIMPSTLWFIAQVADALTALGMNENWEKGGTQTVDDTVEAASTMLRSFQPMIGYIFPVVLAAMPANMLACDGSTYLRVDYPLLYAALDSAFIVDADHFVVPDLRDNVIIGAGSTYAVNQAVGEAAHTLVTAEIPSHGHVDTGHSHVEGNATPALITIGAGAPAPSAVPGVGVTGSGNASITNTGGDGAHNNIQPSVALNYGIIAL